MGGVIGREINFQLNERERKARWLRAVFENILF
jgi:hypothetical protein